MLRDIITRKLVVILAIVTVFGLVAVLAGCGSKEAESTTATDAQPTQPVPNAAATGPAISDKLTFDQLALEQPAKRVKSKQGPTCLHFSYSDQSGKVYKCVLPAAMANGSYPPNEWLRIFGLYRLPDVVKTKAPKANPLSKGVADFPFISPRPTSTPSPTTVPSGGAPEPAPMAPPPPPPPTPPSSTGGRTLDQD